MIRVCKGVGFRVTTLWVCARMALRPWKGLIMGIGPRNAHLHLFSSSQGLKSPGISLLIVGRDWATHHWSGGGGGPRVGGQQREMISGILVVSSLHTNTVSVH